MEPRSPALPVSRPLDWRFLNEHEAAGLQDAEAARWLSTLHWDTRATLARVEAARHAGALPGQAVRDAHGALRGWTFYLVHESVLQIGAFVADSSDTTQALLDATLASPEAAAVSSAMCFVFSSAPGLAELLTARGFAVERYRYLCVDLARPSSRTTDAAGGAPMVSRSAPAWFEPAHRAAVASLLRTAYAADTGARPFAPRGTAAEWLDYVTQLVTTTACGTFLTGVSVLARHGADGELAGATMMTQLSEGTAHLAQLAVAPPVRGRGVARRLLAASLDAARDAGNVRATLLVSERNARARRLYAEMGFEEIAAFVSAVRDQPRRSSSAELDNGGAMTLR